MNQIVYPDQYALEQAFGEFWKSQHVDIFSKDMGVFITNASQDDVAQFLSCLFYEYSQLEQIRKSALQLHGISALFGFRIRAENDLLDLASIIDKYRGQQVDARERMTIKPLIKVADNNIQPKYKGSIEYLQNKPGRVQFLQGSERSFDYQIRQSSDEHEWEIIVDCSRSNDGRLMEDWIRRILPKGNHIHKIDQDELTTEQTIKFFDELGNEGAGTQWRFTQVKRLVLRREEVAESDDEEEVVETDSTVLSGISQAILEGNELRDNLFVKQSESGGYRFSAMTYEYENIEHPYLRELRAEFKKRPKVFEVSLEKYSRRVGLEESTQTHILSDEDRILMLSEFWNKARRVFNKLTSTNTKSDL